MKYKIPSHLLNHFAEEALKSKANGTHIQILAFAAGKIEEDYCVVEELVFPSQHVPTTQVEDLGIEGLSSFQWISQNSQSFKRNTQKASVIFWANSHAKGNEGLTSADLHYQYELQHQVPTMLGCIFVLGKNQVVDFDFLFHFIAIVKL